MFNCSHEGAKLRVPRLEALLKTGGISYIAATRLQDYVYPAERRCFKIGGIILLNCSHEIARLPVSRLEALLKNEGILLLNCSHEVERLHVSRL